ncbi:hypothetical protein BU24DRAFT_427108 [Aaosphaeria arxii CBS 175.79]|uniref:DUF7779 domain-containing protein n=1 Tax=Aaosphaeria arxii CBS 175.79 TaxID=1450172 RepID=A0A6A5XDM9_9PLEO|nr:uncharacterized protein BU24DRAFT_427108 [Aaosphaeria arxii CBS 175.79]KAF2010917.1 hypothetical protein BU24DRAFT_427108 [Aaosphaeria arxii CBS 175.79]
MTNRTPRILERVPKQNPDGTDIIYVDGFEGAEPDLAHGEWVNQLHTICQANISAAIIHLPLGMQFANRPDDLTNALHNVRDILLLELYAFYEQRTSHIVFVGFRLAGIALKQALCSARQNQESNAQARSLLDNIDGIILVGTPQLDEVDKVDAAKALSRLISGKSIPGKKVTKLDEPLKSVKKIAHDFDNQYFDFPIATFVETVRKQYGRRRFRNGGRREERVWVDKAAGRTIPMSGELADFFKGANDLELTDLLKEIAQKARRRANNYGILQEETRTDTTSSDIAASAGSSSSERVRQPLSDIKSRARLRKRLANTKSMATSVPTARVPCYYHLPKPPTNGLFGRDDLLKDIHKALTEGSAVSSNAKQRAPQGAVPPQLRAFVLSGKPGFGKTSVAKEYIQRYKANYDTIAWIDADNKLTLISEYAAFASSLDIVSAQENDDTAIVAVLRQWLHEPESRNRRSNETKPATWLIVMDDAKAANFTVDLWPREADGAILVISRNQNLRSRAFLDTNGCDLGPLSTHEAVRLFSSIAGLPSSSSNDPNIIDIVQDWQCIPYAVASVATAFRNGVESLSQFKLSQASQKKRFLDQGTSSLPSIAAMWALDKRSPSEAALLSVLAFLRHVQIPEQLLTTHWAITNLGYYPDPNSYISCRKSLQEDRLLHYNENSETLSIDEILQGAIKATYLKDSTTFSRAFIATSRLLCAAWPKEVTAEVNFSLINVKDLRDLKQALLSHIDHVSNSYQNAGLEVQRHCATRELATVLVETAWFCMGRGLYPRALPLLDTFDVVKIHVAEDMVDLVSSRHSTAGAIAMAINDHKTGLRHYHEFKSTQDIMFKETGALNSKYAAAHSELGMAYIYNEEATEAVKQLFDDSIQIRKQLPGYEEINLFNCLRGKAYWHHLKEEFDEASSLLKEAVKHRSDKYGVDDKRSGRSAGLLFDLGNVTYRQNFDKNFVEWNDLALEPQSLPSSVDQSPHNHKPVDGTSPQDLCMNYYTRALNIYLEVKGDEHVDVAHARVMIARQILVNQDRSRLHEAELLLDQAIGTLSRTGYYNREIARALFLQSEVLRHEKRPGAGSARRMEAMDVRDELCPADKIPLDELKMEHFDSLVHVLIR